MAVAMAIAFVVALVRLPGGRVTEVVEAPPDAPA
jgi:hypothetical protein